MQRLRTSPAQQDARRAQLVELRQRRTLTEAERDEEERLEKALYLRTYRKTIAADQARIDRRIARQFT